MRGVERVAITMSTTPWDTETLISPHDFVVEKYSVSQHPCSAPDVTMKDRHYDHATDMQHRRSWTINLCSRSTGRSVWADHGR